MIHLNIGSNLYSKFGNKFTNISIAVDLLLSLKITIKKISNFYQTPSYPNNELPKFVNIGLIVDYKKDFKSLYNEVSIIEKKIGRIKTKKNDPRVCDIDIIDYKGLIRSDDKLNLPHPRAYLRNFVLYPIKEIDPNWKHPVFNKNVDLLIKELSQKSRIEITRLRKSVNIRV